MINLIMGLVFLMLAVFYHSIHEPHTASFILGMAIGQFIIGIVFLCIGR